MKTFYVRPAEPLAESPAARTSERPGHTTPLEESAPLETVPLPLAGVQSTGAARHPGGERFEGLPSPYGPAALKNPAGPDRQKRWDVTGDRLAAASPAAADYTLGPSHAPPRVPGMGEHWRARLRAPAGAAPQIGADDAAIHAQTGLMLQVTEDGALVRHGGLDDTAESAAHAASALRPDRALRPLCPEQWRREIGEESYNAFVRSAARCAPLLRHLKDTRYPDLTIEEMRRALLRDVRRDNQRDRFNAALRRQYSAGDRPNPSAERSPSVSAPLFELSAALLEARARSGRPPWRPEEFKAELLAMARGDAIVELARLGASPQGKRAERPTLETLRAEEQSARAHGVDLARKFGLTVPEDLSPAVVREILELAETVRSDAGSKTALDDFAEWATRSDPELSHLLEDVLFDHFLRPHLEDVSSAHPHAKLDGDLVNLKLVVDLTAFMLGVSPGTTEREAIDAFLAQNRLARTLRPDLSPEDLGAFRKAYGLPPTWTGFRDDRPGERCWRDGDLRWDTLSTAPGEHGDAIRSITASVQRLATIPSESPTLDAFFALLPEYRGVFEDFAIQDVSHGMDNKFPLWLSAVLQGGAAGSDLGIKVKNYSSQAHVGMLLREVLGADVELMVADPSQAGRDSIQAAFREAQVDADRGAPLCPLLIHAEGVHMWDFLKEMSAKHPRVPFAVVSHTSSDARSMGEEDGYDFPIIMMSTSDVKVADEKYRFVEPLAALLMNVVRLGHSQDIYNYPALLKGWGRIMGPPMGIALNQLFQFGVVDPSAAAQERFRADQATEDLDRGALHRDTAEFLASLPRAANGDAPPILAVGCANGEAYTVDEVLSFGDGSILFHVQSGQEAFPIKALVEHPSFRGFRISEKSLGSLHSIELRFEVDGREKTFYLLAGGYVANLYEPAPALLVEEGMTTNLTELAALCHAAQVVRDEVIPAKEAQRPAGAAAAAAAAADFVGGPRPLLGLHVAHAELGVDRTGRAVKDPALDPEADLTGIETKLIHHEQTPDGGRVYRIEWNSTDPYQELAYRIESPPPGYGADQLRFVIRRRAVPEGEPELASTENASREIVSEIRVAPMKGGQALALCRGDTQALLEVVLRDPDAPPADATRPPTQLDLSAPTFRPGESRLFFVPPPKLIPTVRTFRPRKFRLFFVHPPDIDPGEVPAVDDPRLRTLLEFDPYADRAIIRMGPGGVLEKAIVL